MTASHHPINGGCLCRAIRYTVTFPPDSNPIKPICCQCTMCRKQTGSLIICFLPVFHDQLTWVTTPQAYESSPGRFRDFCAKCGSSLAWRANGEKTVDLMTGTLDEEVLLGPSGKLLTEPVGGQYWCCKFIKGVTDKWSNAGPKLVKGLALGEKIED